MRQRLIGALEGHRGAYEVYTGVSMLKRGAWEARIVCVTLLKARSHIDDARPTHAGA